MTDTTLLVLDGMGVPPYSARGITQTLSPIAAAAQMRRTVNGELVDLSASQFRKYASSISCNDQQSPAVEGIWPGMIVDVSCAAELSFETSTGGASREIVAGSEREEGDFTFYRPKLRMMVVAFEVSRDEWGASVGWRMDLEEV